MQFHPKGEKFFAILFATFSVVSPLTAADCTVIYPEKNYSSFENTEIEKELKSYFSSHSLFPILTEEPTQYEIATIFEDYSRNVTYAIGLFHQGETHLVALFSFEKGWIWNTTKLIYLTTEIPPSPELVRDICDLAEVALKKSSSSLTILIQDAEIPSDEAALQKWTFFNENESIKLLVILVESPDGGTDFAVTLWPK